MNEFAPQILYRARKDIA